MAVDHDSQKELRNSVGEVLRRADAGERFTITVPGRPVAEFGPAACRSWVSGPAREAAFATAARRTLNEDLERVPGSLVDPFAPSHASGDDSPPPSPSVEASRADEPPTS